MFFIQFSTDMPVTVHCIYQKTNPNLNKKKNDEKNRTWLKYVEEVLVHFVLNISISILKNTSFISSVSLQ